MVHATTRMRVILSQGPPITLFNSIAASDREGRPLYALRHQLHEIACQQGRYCYQDPITNELIATAVFFAKHPELVDSDVAAERHCPFTIVERRARRDTQRLLRDDSASALHSVDARRSVSVGSAGSSNRDGGSDSLSGSLRSSDDASNWSNASETTDDDDDDDVGVGEANADSNARRDAQRRLLVSPFNRPHSRPLKLAELHDMEDIASLPRYAQAGRLHRACIAQGLDCYTDPATGLLTFTRPFLQRAPCCGEFCRHCPYGHAACRESDAESMSTGDDTDDDTFAADADSGADQDDVFGDHTADAAQGDGTISSAALGTVGTAAAAAAGTVKHA